MTSNFQINPENKTFGSGEGVSSNTNTNAKNSRPAVPIFVYQQLAENFHQTQTELAQTKKFNEELMAQNQKLRQEIITILQTVEEVQQNIKFLNIPQFSDFKNDSFSNKLEQEKPDLPDNFSSIDQLDHQSNGKISDTIVEESNLPVMVSSNPKIKPVSSPMVKVKKKRPKPPFKKDKLEHKNHDGLSNLEDNHHTLNGWLLFLAILLIVMTAFGAGFVVMRPLLSPNHSNYSVPNR